MSYINSGLWLWCFTPNRSNWTGILTGFNMELVVTSTKACKNVSMANISNIRNICFVSKYKLKFSIELHFPMYCPSFENHRRELFSNVLNYNAAIAILSAEDKFVWILSNEDPACLRELAKFIHSFFFKLHHRRFSTGVIGWVYRPVSIWSLWLLVRKRVRMFLWLIFLISEI
jgi:hypothetical protein